MVLNAWWTSFVNENCVNLPTFSKLQPKALKNHSKIQTIPHFKHLHALINCFEKSINITAHDNIITNLVQLENTLLKNLLSVSDLS
jgi:hypothetical protein